MILSLISGKKMGVRLHFYAFFVLFGLSTPLFADFFLPEEGKIVFVSIDNDFIQTFRGRLGRWVLPGTIKLEDAARELGSSKEEIQTINGVASSGKPLFVPMSEDVYNTLIMKGFGRRIVQVDTRRYIWPVESPSYSSRFGRRGRNEHHGLDLACVHDTVVVAAADGEVIASGWLGGMGNAIIIRHENGLETRYAHNTTLLVAEGEMVKRGQIISRSGSTGISTGPHVHFEVRYMGVALNPEDFLPIGFRNPELVFREGAGNSVNIEGEMVYGEAYRP
jgi:hypothetical protein